MAYIFVFGSNLQGIHGAGTALYARQHHGAQLFNCPIDDQWKEYLPGYQYFCH